MRRIAPLSALTGVAAALAFPPRRRRPTLMPDLGLTRGAPPWGGGQKARVPRPRIRESMSTEPKPTKQERRDAARAARIEAEQAEAAASLRRRRLRTLLAVLGAAAVLVVVAIVVSCGGANGAKSRPGAAQKATGAIPGQKESAEMLAGIPQKRHLPRQRRPRRCALVEFADLQCPFCREYTLQIAAAARAGLRAHGQGPHGVPRPLLPRQGLGDGGAPRRRRAARAEQALELRRRLLLQPGRGELGLRDAEPSCTASTRPPGVDAAKADAFAGVAGVAEAAGKRPTRSPTSSACSRRRRSSSASAAAR